MKKKKQKRAQKKQKRCVRCIVKRRGHVEEFDERKVYATCYRACKNADIHDDKAEKICEKVSAHMKKWVGTKKCITSDAIFSQLVKALRTHDKNAAFMYETHRDIC